MRELHHARLASAAARGLGPSSPFLAAAPFSLQLRSFWNGNALTTTLRNLQLKRLEREANQLPEDASIQYSFLQDLASDHPTAVISRLTHPSFSHFAINREIAILYLQALQRTNSLQQLNANDLLQRLATSNSPTDAMAGLTPDKLQQFSSELAEQKLSKPDQAQYLMQLLTSGGAPALATAAAPAAAHLSSSIVPPQPAALTRGMDPKSPLHVQVASASGGARSAVLGFLARAGLLLVAFSAVGALLDERGIGRGMGMSSNSKHVQEAEHTEQKVKFDDVKGVEEAKAGIGRNCHVFA